MLKIKKWNNFFVVIILVKRRHATTQSEKNLYLKKIRYLLLSLHLYTKFLEHVQ